MRDASFEFLNLPPPAVSYPPTQLQAADVLDHVPPPSRGRGGGAEPESGASPETNFRIAGVIARSRSDRSFLDGPLCC